MRGVQKNKKKKHKKIGKTLADREKQMMMMMTMMMMTMMSTVPTANDVVNQWTRNILEIFPRSIVTIGKEAFYSKYDESRYQVS